MFTTCDALSQHRVQDNRHGAVTGTLCSEVRIPTEPVWVINPCPDRGSVVKLPFNAVAAIKVAWKDY